MLCTIVFTPSAFTPSVFTPSRSLCSWQWCSAPVFAQPVGEAWRPLLKQYCLHCHDTETQEGDLDLERFSSLADIRQDTGVWQAVLQQIADGEMPPADQPQFTAEHRSRFISWVEATLHKLALEQAGDPGPVVLRRLSNHEYTYTLRDLTGLPKLDPAREFPVDGAAGEGFTNVGSALVMSPALFTKYLDAAKEVANHVVLLPDRIAFSASTSRADWTQEKLDAIRALYSKYSVPGDATARDLQGVKFSMADGGVIPLRRYLNAIGGGNAEGLSPKYLNKLTAALADKKPSLLLDQIRAVWRNGQPDSIESTAREIAAWQQALWHFAKVGHIGKRDGPTGWQSPVIPIAIEQNLSIAFPKSSASDLSLFLTVGDAGDGAEGDVVAWDNARLTFPDRAPIPLSQVTPLIESVRKRQRDELVQVAAYLDACADAFQTQKPVRDVAQRKGLAPDRLAVWAEWLQLDNPVLTPLGHLIGKNVDVGGYAALLGWGSGLPSLIVNQSEEDISFSTLTVPAYGVTVHPAPEIDSVIYWQSPLTASISIAGRVADADRVCGNGAAWSVELISAGGRRTLGSDHFENGGHSEFGPLKISVQTGDLLKFTVTARERDHSCDTTQLSLKLVESEGGQRVWDLAQDVVDRIHEGNPLADTFGNPAVWHFCNSRSGESKPAIPPESTLGKWCRAVVLGTSTDSLEVSKQLIAPETAADQVVAALYHDFRGPLGWLAEVDTNEPQAASTSLGKIQQKAPATLEFHFPASLVMGAEFQATVRMDPDQGREGSVQVWATSEKPAGPLALTPGTLIPASAASGESWTAGVAPVVSDRPILVHAGSQKQQRLLEDIHDFQSLFPAALCYTKIVPVDEVVTLTLRYREDNFLQQLMLTDDEVDQLDQLWDELLFISRQPLQQLDAFKQLWQYATQDADPSAFEPLREPIQRAATDFERRLLQLEPRQVQSVLDFAKQAWRRPLDETEQAGLKGLYGGLRDQGLSHEASIRTLVARVLVAPNFLYRGESPAPGRQPAAVDDWELATRLSYFLWSSAPDGELRAAASQGKLRDPNELIAQTQRMLASPKIRRLATEFGCQWLHVRDLETLEEKSERHFPTFLGLRGDMQEEVVRFFMDLFQRNRTILSLLDADYSFVNQRLAQHYAIDTPTSGWQRIEGLRAMGRGGILGFAGTLAKHSGASRTSPILRGNWISEALLGEELPKPPKDVPVLPAEPPAGLTERELIERHSSDATCARCHSRIDPFGFALEGFDAIGRARSGMNTAARLADGTNLNGIEGLRAYLRDARREEFVRQFCRKLLGYALGRSVQLSDKPLLDRMLLELRANDFHVNVAVEMIVDSPQFRQVRGQDF